MRDAMQLPNSNWNAMRFIRNPFLAIVFHCMIELQAIQPKGNKMASKRESGSKARMSAMDELWQLLYRGQMVTQLSATQSDAMREIAREHLSGTEQDAISNLSDRFGIAWHEAIALMDDSDRRITGERLGHSLLRNGNAINRLAGRSMNYPIGYSRNPLTDPDTDTVRISTM